MGNWPQKRWPPCGVWRKRRDEGGACPFPAGLAIFALMDNRIDGQDDLAADTGALEGGRHWHRLSFAVPPERADELAAMCHALGSLGSHVEDEEGACRLLAYFDSSCDMEGVGQGLEPFLRQLGLEAPGPVQRQEERDWLAEWRRFFTPVWATPRIVVRPSWTPVPLEGDQVEVVVDPQMAFGTGGHESTQLCLALAERAWKRGGRCLDLGCGSGVLAIAALKSGVAEVVAVDVDPAAVANARDNIRANGVEMGARVLHGGIEAASGVFDTVLANILFPVLAPLLPDIRDLLQPGGEAVFSGLLAKEEEAFAAAVVQAGMEVTRRADRNGWLALGAQR